MNPSIICEIPYAEMRPDSYDPTGWMASMDLVCDGDREVVIVIYTGNEPQKLKEPDKTEASGGFFSYFRNIGVL